MGYNTENTEWPTATPVPEVQKTIIDTLFNLLDDKSAGVGDKLADEIFTSDGILHGGAGTAKGTDAIRHARDNAWKIIHTRRHKVLRVYVHDAEAKDLLIVGHVTMGFPNGKENAGEFTARILFVAPETEGGKPKIKDYNVWADTAPLSKAIQEALADAK
ncbi:hypothetical protein BU16DRAFT_564979 [Lophium mytilinum]|uniref:SnoaL-like domain-containing protein n=1 Tax=Lophium mytilinum TaxID=390894 RepID=A0A6A6QG73_9PEZI|nr:hypothetical protein BU16DRAFT_564979 [Lophium mytilinum]